MSGSAGSRLGSREMPLFSLANLHRTDFLVQIGLRICQTNLGRCDGTRKSWEAVGTDRSTQAEERNRWSMRNSCACILTSIFSSPSGGNPPTARSRDVYGGMGGLGR